MRKFFLAIAILAGVTAYASKPIKVACIGDSITRGAGIGDPDHDSYPAALQRMLGDGFEVRNYGSDARIMSLEGDHPYMKEHHYAEAKAFLPDIVIIMMGSNDSKPHNWNQELYRKSYDTMIRELKKLPSHPDIYVCLPPPPYEVKWGINDSTIVAGVIPVVRETADHHWLEVIDLHTAMSGMQENFVDNIHPNETGAVIIARNIYDTLKDNGWVGHKCKKVVFVGDSITDGFWGRFDGIASIDRNHYDMNHIYGHGFPCDCAAYFMAKYPHKGFHFYNRGSSGDTLNGVSSRWDEDVLTVNPDVISLLVGINDTSRKTYDTFDFTGWEKKLRDLIDKTAAYDPDCRMVLCTPFLVKRGAVGRGGNYDDRRAMVDRLDEIVKKVAAEYGLVCVDFASLVDRLVEDDKSGDRNYWMWDGVHPTMQGHLKLAELWIRKAGKKALLK